MSVEEQIRLLTIGVVGLGALVLFSMMARRGAGPPTRISLERDSRELLANIPPPPLTMGFVPCNCEGS